MNDCMLPRTAGEKCEGLAFDEEKIAQAMEVILREGLGLDMSDPNLTDTPRRVAKMYTRELFAGLLAENEPAVTVFPNEGYDQMIASDRVFFTSMCSHHLVPFTGYAWLFYIPGENLAGISKLSRILHYYAARPQLQERLAQQVLDYIVNKLQPKGAMVVLRALHQCTICRGVKNNPDSGMITSAVHGCFGDMDVRMEAMNLINLSMSVR